MSMKSMNRRALLAGLASLPFGALGIVPPAIAEENKYWCEGFVPLGPTKLRTLSGIGWQYCACPCLKGLSLPDIFERGFTTKTEGLLLSTPIAGGSLHKAACPLYTAWVNR